MIRRTRDRQRGGFTLVELLVAIGIIIVLASIALLVVPDILEQDRTTDGANMTRQWLMIAKARAARDGLPRGVRLINPGNGLATELQYTESPPVLIPTTQPGVQAGDINNAPHVLITYTHQTGVIQTRQYQIRNLTAAQGQEILPGSVIALPELGTWLRVLTPSTPAAQTAPLNTSLTTVTVTVQTAPDDQMGAATSYATFLFGIYLAPRPLIGEPTQQLPKNICIDLNVSQPAGTNAPTPADYDITFAPSGQVLYWSEGQINLWVRDSTKGGGQLSMASFQAGGEQQVVAIKTKTGALGVFPIAWDASDASAPFQFARLGATAPSQ